MWAGEGVVAADRLGPHPDPQRGQRPVEIEVLAAGPGRARCPGGDPASLWRVARVSPACCSLRTARPVWTRNSSSRDRLAIRAGAVPPAAAAAGWPPRSARPAPPWAPGPGWLVAPSACTRMTAFRSLPKPRPGAPTSLATTRSQRFSAGAWPWPGPPAGRRSGRSRRRSRPGRAARPRRLGAQGRPAGPGWRTSASGEAPRPAPPAPRRRRASLPGWRAAGRKSATAAAITTTSACAAAASSAACISRALSTSDAPVDPGRGGQRDRPGDQGDLGAQRGGGAGQREAHLPRGAVAQEAHVVDRLEGGTRGDHHPLAGQRPPGRRPAPGWPPPRPPPRRGPPGGRRRSSRRPARPGPVRRCSPARCPADGAGCPG